MPWPTLSELEPGIAVCYTCDKYKNSPYCPIFVGIVKEIISLPAGQVDDTAAVRVEVRIKGHSETGFVRRVEKRRATPQDVRKHGRIVCHGWVLKKYGSTYNQSNEVNNVKTDPAGDDAHEIVAYSKGTNQPVVIDLNVWNSLTQAHKAAGKPTEEVDGLARPVHSWSIIPLDIGALAEIERLSQQELLDEIDQIIERRYKEGGLKEAFIEAKKQALQADVDFSPEDLELYKCIIAEGDKILMILEVRWDQAYSTECFKVDDRLRAWVEEASRWESTTESKRESWLEVVSKRLKTQRPRHSNRLHAWSTEVVAETAEMSSE